MNDPKNKKTPRSVLGRGLSALISTPQIAAVPRGNAVPQTLEGMQSDSSPTMNRPLNVDSKEVIQLDINLLEPNPTQPRRRFSESELKELSDSIRSVGVIQPVVARAAVKDGKAVYQIVAGERRWRASKLAGLTQVPVLIESFDDIRVLEVSLIENIQRQNLNPIEESLAYKRLADEFSLTQVQIAERVGKDRATVANFLRLLTLPDQVQELIRDGIITMGHAKAILGVREPSAQISLARKTVAENLSVRALETLVSRVVVLDAGKRLPSDLSAAKVSSKQSAGAYPELVDRMRRALGTKVAIKHHKAGRGKVEIEYFSEQELERVVEHIAQSSRLT